MASHESQLGESIQKQSLRCLNTLTDCEDNKEKIKEISKKIGLKSMKKYQKLMEIIYKNNATVTMYDTVVPEGFHTKEINSELAKRIYNAINDADKKPAEKVTYFGKLTGVNVRSYKFEFVIVDSQEIINGIFEKSFAEETKKRLDTTTNIQFELTTIYDDVLDEEKKKWSIVAFID